MSRLLHFLARCSAYLIALLLGAVWSVGALDTMTRPLLDLGRPLVGDAIIAVAAALMLAPDFVMPFARLLAGLKFMVGAFLLTALVSAIVEKIRFGSCDDALLDVALFIAALASILSALPGLIHGGEPLLAAIGELMLCVIASVLAIYGRGYLVSQEIPPPVRPAFGYGTVN
jgi:hypothetical protein